MGAVKISPQSLLALALLLAPGTPVESVNASDPGAAKAHNFPGSPTIRVDGRDIEPGFRDDGDCTPRCRLYRTPDGLRGVPPREWIEAALRREEAALRPGSRPFSPG